MMLKITDTAKEKFTEILAEQDKAGAYIRLYISGVG
jgi:Fe-S cluster assembly iron-binding protein IscA